MRLGIEYAMLGVTLCLWSNRAAGSRVGEDLSSSFLPFMDIATFLYDTSYSIRFVYCRSHCRMSNSLLDEIER